MATTHVFIVDSNTFKLHLEYLFAGTGAKDKKIDFNNQSNSTLHYAAENNLVGMISDICRVRINDYIIFYLQQNSSAGIREGKFYGIFKVSELAFIDHNDDEQFLKESLGKSLTFRIKIEPFEVYSDGVTEWEALDEIREISSANQMLWSLIYRKLKGNRGNTMITAYEFERLRQLLRNKNTATILDGRNFTFNINSQKIIVANYNRIYQGRKENINLLPRIIQKYQLGSQFESHLQAYILQNINIFFDNIEWIGNEVSCGVGMQRIDILLSQLNGINRVCIPIELKSTIAYKGITSQIQRYVDWLKQYYLPNHQSDISPFLISRLIEDKDSDMYRQLIQEFKEFNCQNNLILKYIEFNIVDGIISFCPIQYENI